LHSDPQYDVDSNSLDDQRDMKDGYINEWACSILYKNHGPTPMLASSDEDVNYLSQDMSSHSMRFTLGATSAHPD